MADTQIDFSTYSAANAHESKDMPLHIKIGNTVVEASSDLVKVTGATVIVESPNVQLGGEGGKKGCSDRRQGECRGRLVQGAMAHCRGVILRLCKRLGPGDEAMDHNLIAILSRY
jgi:hypothetical protein